MILIKRSNFKENFDWIPSKWTREKICNSNDVCDSSIENRQFQLLYPDKGVSTWVSKIFGVQGFGSKFDHQTPKRTNKEQWNSIFELEFSEFCKQNICNCWKESLNWKLVNKFESNFSMGFQLNIVRRWPTTFTSFKRIPFKSKTSTAVMFWLHNLPIKNMKIVFPNRPLALWKWRSSTFWVLVCKSYTVRCLSQDPYHKNVVHFENEKTRWTVLVEHPNRQQVWSFSRLSQKSLLRRQSSDLAKVA